MNYTPCIVMRLHPDRHIQGYRYCNLGAVTAYPNTYEDLKQDQELAEEMPRERQLCLIC